MDTIKEAFLSPKQGLQNYSEQILKAISTRTSLFNLTSDGIQTVTAEPVNYIPVTNLFDRVSLILNEESEMKARTSYRTTDILSMTAGYDNLRTLYETTVKGSGSGSELSIETVSQQNPVRAVSLLTSDPRICTDPPMYPEAVLTFIEMMSSTITNLIPEDEQKEHIFEIMDLGVGNGEILAACASIPNCIYTGVDTRLPEDFTARTTTDAPIRHDSRGLIDIFSLSVPFVASKCMLYNKMLSKEELETVNKYDMIFIHVDFYTATRGNVGEYMPYLSDTGLIIVYGNPLRSDIWKDLYELGGGDGDRGVYGFWGMIGIQNVQKTVSPFLVLSKNGTLLDTKAMDLSIFLGRAYGNYIKVYNPSEVALASASGAALTVESVTYRKRSVPQIVGNLYKGIRIRPGGPMKDIVKMEGDGEAGDLEKYLDLFPIPPESETDPRRRGRAPTPTPTVTTLRIFSVSSGYPVEQIILSRANPNIRIHHTRHSETAAALKEYRDYKAKYDAREMDSFFLEIFTGEMFKMIQETIEKSSPRAGAGKGRMSPPAVILYHRDNFITSLLISFLAKLKVKIGILFSFNSDSGVLSLETISQVSALYPGGVSYFYNIQDAFAQFDDNVAVILNLASDIRADEITTPLYSEKQREASRAFKVIPESSRGYDYSDESRSYYQSTMAVPAPALPQSGDERASEGGAASASIL